MASMLFATSCSDQNDFNGQAGQGGSLTFNVGVAQTIGGSRAISDGTGADLLVYQVYDAQGNEVVGQGGTTTMADKHGTVSVTLPAGSYDVVFWAQNQACTAYNYTNLKDVSIDYKEALCNDETRDAFYAVKNITVNGDEQMDVTLYRPFAQINVAFDGEETFTNSQLTIAGDILTNINLLTGIATGSESEVTFATNTVPTEALVTEVNGEEQSFTYVAMAYLLANTDPATYNVTTVANDGQKEFTPADNVPVQRNYRTNIIYNVPDGTVDFTVTVDPQYNEPDMNELQGKEEGEEPEEPATPEFSSIIVSNVEGGYELTAKYTPVDLEIESAVFTLTPAATSLSRAEGVVEVQATAENGVMTATVKTEQLTAGMQYTVTASINGTTSDAEVSQDATIDVPAVTEPVYMYIMGEGEGLSWTSFPGKAVELGSDGFFTVTIANLNSFKISKVKSTGWDDFNEGAYEIASGSFGDGVSQTGGQTLSLQAGSENNIETPWAGSYTVKVKGDFSNINLYTTTAKPTTAPEAYLVGAVTNWGINSAYKFSVTTQGSNYVYTLDCSIPVNSEFKIAGVNSNGALEWGGPINYSTGSTITSFGASLIAYYNNQANMKFEEAFSGTITLTIPTTAKQQGTIVFKQSGNITYPENMYVVGNVNGAAWAADNGTKMNNQGNGIYTLTVTFAENGGSTGFAVASKLGANSGDWNTLNANRFGPATTDTPAVMGDNKASLGDLTWKIDPGTYNLSFDYGKMVLNVQKAN